jgi:hypothetical protein
MDKNAFFFRFIETNINLIQLDIILTLFSAMSPKSGKLIIFIISYDYKNLKAK